MLGCTSSQVGELLLSRWHVPPSIVHGATFAERPEGLPEDAPREWRDLVTITELAILCADVLFFRTTRRPA